VSDATGSRLAIIADFGKLHRHIVDFSRHAYRLHARR
jgi:hypothetical protein